MRAEVGLDVGGIEHGHGVLSGDRAAVAVGAEEAESEGALACAVDHGGLTPSPLVDREELKVACEIGGGLIACIAHGRRQRRAQRSVRDRRALDDVGLLRADELAAFATELRRLHADVRGTAAFHTMERWLEIDVVGDGYGHFIARCEARDEAGIGNTLPLRAGLRSE